MKAVVLGGAGVEGSYAAKCLAEGSVFSEVCVADIDRKRGKELSKTSEKMVYKYVDVTDKKSLSNVIRDADVVVNCVGPFYKYASSIMETTIAKCLNYVDICDDYDATQLLLEKFYKEAEKAGVTCVVGLGASPGLTNILVAHSAE
ncbi:MAG TPA: NAD-dependent epimerase/dehydratase family protein, partial [Thermoplasmatales archaeon]|nr:NAD-dependent epimerase/dehydratase family protein [Thermoplasmatales archaeon]